eukprot:GHRR01021900.1.p1 GENE.GHRR01021900.1~~GHRR01021900.1.p1  ORF type:complete len:296 (+),score=94.51 GHRR01021900.1:216-1103(+)
MGNSSSRIDRFYGNYEKSFERIEHDVKRLKGRIAVRSKRRFSLSTWSGSIVALTILVAAGVIYQVQQKSPGTYSYQQHVSWIGGAMALPACAFALHWLLVFVLGAVEGRDVRKLKALEAAKRNMIKELKDMSRFDKIKSLIDKFDPDAAQASPAVANSAGGLQGPNYSAPAPGRLQQQHHQYQQQQRLQQPQVPALLMKGSGQVAGAAALAVTGAGKAILPLFDKLATTLISDNPVLLEDLRSVIKPSQTKAKAHIACHELGYVWLRQDMFCWSRCLAPSTHRASVCNVCFPAWQ